MSEGADALATAIEDVASAYYRLVILAGPPGSGKTSVLQRRAQSCGDALINVNLELSSRLLELPRLQRARHVHRILAEILDQTDRSVVLLDNLEILFDPALEVDPLRLLQASSRNRTLVAAWNGRFQDRTLTYAEPGHPEFQRWKAVEACVLSQSEP